MASRHDAQAPELEIFIQRGRPWLYPYNRRLRHLHGISIRNVSLASPKSRPRGNTLDDTALPTALKSPAKALAQREQKQLEHSRSSTDLKAIAESQDGTPSHPHETESHGSPSKRPAIRKVRRRSTFDWQSASSQWRQKKLEDVISSNMADVFFSMHIADQEEPVYVSEVVEKTMNPDFRFFNLNASGPSVSRLEDLTIKLWAQGNGGDDYMFLVEMHVNLRSLQFIGKTIEGFPQSLPQNCILFHMKDGIYTTFLDNFTGETSVPNAAPPRTMSISHTLPTSSYDALMRLSTLDECIQDALATRAKLENEINLILESNAEAISTVRDAAYQATALSELNDAVASERKRLALAKRRRDEAQARLVQRKELMATGRRSITDGDKECSILREQADAVRGLLTSSTDETLGQRRRICEDLQKIYPISPIEGKTLHFSIHDVSLSNSTFDDDSPGSTESTAAALGHVALLVHNLSFYLSTPLPYPLTTRGSTSTILDPISSVSGTSRTYPLFPGKGPRFRFEFAVFLLNKDIEVLSGTLGIRVMDLRQTLPNLKYLLYVLTAGKGDAPMRKAGGIRGFLRGGENSRRESLDSQASGSTGIGLDDERKGQMLPPPRVPLSKASIVLNNAAVRKSGMNGYGVIGRGSKLRDVS